jgi:hypothetical protein
VIGSGIMQELNMRASEDVDVVVAETEFDRLTKQAQLKEETAYGRKILVGDDYEIGTSWDVLGVELTIDDLGLKSIVLRGVRYITPAFLLEVKESWIAAGTPRQKDVDDAKLLREYMAMNHRYKKEKDGFKIDAVDPVQDIMGEDELKKAEDRIQSLIEQKADSE